MVVVLLIVVIVAILLMCWEEYAHRKCPYCGSKDIVQTTAQLFAAYYCNNCNKMS